MRRRGNRMPAAPQPWPGRRPGPLTYAVLGFWALVCLFPLYWVAVTSLKDGDAIVTGPRYLPFVDFRPSLDSWAFVLTDPVQDLLGRFVNSTVVAFASTALALAAGGMAAYALTRLRCAIPWRLAAIGLAGSALATEALLSQQQRLPALIGLALVLFVLPWFPILRRGAAVGSRTIRIAILASRMVPPVLTVVPLYLVAQTLEILDTRGGLVLVYAAVNLPVALWLLHSVLGARPTEQEEAARLDGASHARILVEILAPMVARGIAGAGLIVFALCWTEYLFAAYLTTDAAQTLPPLVVGQISTGEAQVGGEQREWARFSAAIVLMVLPLLPLTAFAVRHFARAVPRRG
ncbi:MAG: carbohydrate ABC transporter permease [Alphaproteobacteria bacterium]